MDTFTILFVLSGVFAVTALLLLAFRGPVQGNWLLAAILGLGFAGLTIVTIAREGPLGFIPNHTQDLWGIQVWYDLMIAVVIALVFILPRAKAAGMNTTLWVLAVAGTASFALLPMVARLFWLEAHARKPA